MKTKESRLLKYMRTFIAKLLKIDVMYSFIKMEQLEQKEKMTQAIKDMRVKLDRYEQQTGVLLDLVEVGADVHVRTPGSWAVVCLRGSNDRGMVQFYDLPDNITVREMATILRSMQPTHPERMILDTPPGITQHLRGEISRL